MLSANLVFLLTCISHQILASASTTCYCRDEDKINSSCGQKPCGNPSSTGFVQCCAGSDVCGADGFCHFTHPLSWSSGYYLGGCTDPTFQDPSCSQQCTDLPTQDAIYTEATGLWACCYDLKLGLNCSRPTAETFQAPGPDVLFAAPFSLLTAIPSTPTPSNTPTQISAPVVQSSTSIQSTTSIQSSSSSSSSSTTSVPSSTTSQSSTSIPSTTSTQGNTLVQTGTSTQSSVSAQTSPSTTSSTTSTPTSTPSSTFTVANSSQTAAVAPATESPALSTGAKAGIGISISLVVIAGIIALTIFLRQRSRNRHLPIVDFEPKTALTHEMKNWNQYQALSGHYDTKKPMMVAELSEESRPPAELQGSDARGRASFLTNLGRRT